MTFPSRDVIVNANSLQHLFGEVAKRNICWSQRGWCGKEAKKIRFEQEQG
jgi:hypothetical protein